MLTFVALSGAVQMGLILSLLALGIFIAYRILGVPDLTVEGSYAMGASVSAILTVAGQPFLGLVLSIVAGVAAGLCTAFLQTKMRVQPILAGILVMMAAFSVNSHIMGRRPNIPLLREDTLFTLLGDRLDNIQAARFVIPIAVVVIVSVGLGIFFYTRLGLAVRATGDNEEMCRASSINTTKTKMMGLALGNAIAALSGGLIAQYQGFADLHMGRGMVLTALASLIIGEAIFGRRMILWNIGAVIAGAVIYRIIIAWALSTRINQTNLQIITAVFVAVAVSFPAIKEHFMLFKLKRAAKLKRQEAQRDA